MVTSKKGVRRDVPQVPSQDAGEVEGLMTGGRVVSGAGAWLSEKSEGGGSDQLTIVPSPCLFFFPSLSNIFFSLPSSSPPRFTPSLPPTLTHSGREREDKAGLGLGHRQGVGDVGT